MRKLILSLLLLSVIAAAGLCGWPVIQARRLEKALEFIAVEGLDHMDVDQMRDEVLSRAQVLGLSLAPEDISIEAEGEGMEASVDIRVDCRLMLPMFIERFEYPMTLEGHAEMKQGEHIIENL
ncbi:MAG: hypothetical protein D6812_14805 [Deltaproteobacteria bacterium]|nr:MAG: hypothetical protein D6812_14805 [Deltaproteobacteria bacterium]